MTTTTLKLSKHQAQQLFIVLLLSCIVSSLMQTAMTTILPAIMQDLHVTANAGQWLTSAFTLAMGIMIPVTPFLLKRFSTKQIIMAGLSIFAVGLLICTLANSLAMMLVGRVLQAISSGIFVSLTQVAIVQIFPTKQVGTYMGIYGLAVGGLPVFAPTLAGYLADNFGYRSIFLSVLVITLLVLGLSFVIVHNISDGEKAQLDVQSFGLSVIGFGGLTLGLDQLSSTTHHALTLTILAIALIALLLFGIRQTRSKTPFLSLQPFKNINFTTALISSMLLYAVMMAGSLILPMFLQTLRGYSATQSGLITLPGSLVMIVFSPIAGKLYDRFGIKPILILGSLSLFISCWGLSTVQLKTPIWYIIAVYAFRMLAIAMLMMPLVSWGMLKLKPNLATHGSALISALRTYAGAFSMVGMTSMMTHVNHGQISVAGVNTVFTLLTVIAGFQIIIAGFYVVMQRKY